jgi:hypothetical protein
VSLADDLRELQRQFDQQMKHATYFANNQLRESVLRRALALVKLIEQMPQDFSADIGGNDGVQTITLKPAAEVWEEWATKVKEAVK